MPTDNELSLEGFKAFVADVAAKEPERVIDHFSWRTCAVGDYVASTGVRGTTCTPLKFAHSLARPVRDCICNCDTYGELHDYLATVY